MRSKYSAKTHICTLLVFLFFLLCPVKLTAAGLLSKPRKMFVAKTEHFEIIYSKESEETAAILSGAVESLYKKASLELKTEKNLFIPVVISPDSDLLSVEFTPSPYDRIVVFDSPADYDTSNYNDSLLDLFYREIYSALIQKTRSPVNEFLAKYIAGENYQPATIWNLPFSFVDGAAYLEEGKDGLGRINDGYFLQVLSQAKLEGKFPGWMQVSTVVDVPPGEKVVLAAGTAFSAFLISQYGLEQYERLWKECGKINPFSGQQVFYRVYKKTLSELWKEFEQAVPLPSELAELERLEKASKRFLENDKQADFAQVLFTEQGLIWYDKIRHEVSIYDESARFRKRSRLFLADEVEKLSLSQDGRYLSVSYKRSEKKDGLYSCLTSIYDLHERKFLTEVFPLREASFLVRSNGETALCGVNVTEAKSRLQIFAFGQSESDENGSESKSSLIFEKEFLRNEVPFSPVYAGKGFVCCIIVEKAQQKLLRIQFDDEAKKYPEEKYQIDFLDGQFRLRNLQFNKTDDSGFYTFEFGITAAESAAFTRTGIIALDDSYRPEKVSFMQTDVSGGTCEPQINNGELCYISRKYDHNEFRRLALSEFDLVEGRLACENQSVPNQPAHTAALSLENPKLYNPFRYLIHLSYRPGLPIKLIDFDEGILYWPGLGMSVVTQEDPLLNNTIILSAGWNYLPMDFSWTVNLPSQYITKIRHESTKLDKDKSAAIYIENSSTPVTIKAATCFNFNMEGGYDLKAQAGTSWFIPLGLAIKKLTFDLRGIYRASTDYFDEELAAKYPEKYPSLSGWPYIKDAYELWEFSSSLEYSSIHQYGSSRFENKGLKVGARFYAMYEAQEISMNFGVYGSLAIPRLTPLNTWHGWILSAPASLSVDFVNKSGRALETTEEILLIGKEIQQGITPVYVYFRRIGLKASHSFNMKYNMEPGHRPDIRSMNYVQNVFSNVKVSNVFSLILDIDINLAAGKMSSVPISSYIKASYCPEEQYFKFGFDFRLNF